MRVLRGEAPLLKQDPRKVILACLRPLSSILEITGGGTEIDPTGGAKGPVSSEHGVSLSTEITKPSEAKEKAELEEERSENGVFLALNFGVAAGVRKEPILGAMADLRFWDYLGLEVEGEVGLEKNRFVRAHAKFQIPFKSRFIDFTPKIGIGYSAQRLSGAKFDGFSALVGVEFEFGHFLILSAEYTGAKGKKEYKWGNTSTYDLTYYPGEYYDPYPDW